MSEHIGRGAVFWSGQNVRTEQTPDGARLDLVEKGPSRAPFPDHGWNQERLRYNSKKISLKSPAGAVDVPYIHLFTTTDTTISFSSSRFNSWTTAILWCGVWIQGNEGYKITIFTTDFCLSVYQRAGALFPQSLGIFGTLLWNILRDEYISEFLLSW